MNSSGRIRCGSGGGVGLYPPVDLREVANQLDPRNSAQNCDSGADGKRPPEMARAVHDEPSDRADDNACDIAQTVLHASPFVGISTLVSAITSGRLSDFWIRKGYTTTLAR
jgi:hypothetical protein